MDSEKSQEPLLPELLLEDSDPSVSRDPHDVRDAPDGHSASQELPRFQSRRTVDVATQKARFDAFFPSDTPISKPAYGSNRRHGGRALDGRIPEGRLSFDVGKFRIEFASTGSVHTSMMLLPLNVMFDVGTLTRHASLASNVFISHTHWDHCIAMLPQLQLRLLKGAGPTHYHLPKRTVALVEQAVHAWQALDRVPIHPEFHGIQERDVVTLEGAARGYEVRVVSVYHKVDMESLGFVMFEKGVETPVFAYTGDCNWESVAGTPEFLNAHILVMECSFWDDTVSPEHAHFKGHIHMLDVIQHLDAFHCDMVFLVHISYRYTAQQIWGTYERHFPASARSRFIPVL